MYWSDRVILRKYVWLGYISDWPQDGFFDITGVNLLRHLFRLLNVEPVHSHDVLVRSSQRFEHLRQILWLGAPSRRVLQRMCLKSVRAISYLTFGFFCSQLAFQLFFLFLSLSHRCSSAEKRKITRTDLQRSYCRESSFSCSWRFSSAIFSLFCRSSSIWKRKLCRYQRISSKVDPFTWNFFRCSSSALISCSARTCFNRRKSRSIDETRSL